jgi:hypothetical protein
MTGDEKLCKKCGIPKAISEFYRHSRTLDRRQPYCKLCTKWTVEDWRAANLAAHNQRRRAYRKRPEVRERECLELRLNRIRKRRLARKDGTSQ